MVVSGVVGLLVIAFFMKYLRRHSLSVFVWYRIAIWHNSNRSGVLPRYWRMNFLSPTRHTRLNEAVGFLLLLLCLAIWLSLLSYSSTRPLLEHCGRNPACP